MRSAEITLSFTNGWDKVTAARLYIVQANARDDFGTERSFEEIRALCGPGQVVTIENDYYISAWVVSDATGGNMGANPMTTESTINYEVCKKTAYVESIDGSLGFMIETETADDNIFMRYSRIQLALKGVRLVHDTDPDRFSLKGVKSAMIISSQLGTAADIPRKEKRIGQLTDDDIYTYVTLTDCELPIRKGPLTPINEGYANATGANRTEKCASLVRDIEGEHIYLYTNTTCLYRRDGSRLPYGSGKLSGIVVHELFPRFEWGGQRRRRRRILRLHRPLPAAARLEIGFRRAGRRFRRQFFGAADRVPFPAVRQQQGLSDLRHERLPDAQLQGRQRCGQDSGQRGFQLPGSRGQQTELHFRVEHRQRQRHGHYPRRQDRLVARQSRREQQQLRATPRAAARGKVPRKNNAEGPAWVDWYWWDKANDRGHAWIVNFSTEGISTDVLSMQVSVLNDRYDSGKYGSPRYFDVAWSETGDMNADGDWAYIASYTVPDMARWTPATRYWQYAGWKPVDVKLPLEMLGKRTSTSACRRPGTSAEASTNTPRSR